MPRNLALAALVLMLLTGLVLGQFRTLGGNDGHLLPVSNHDTSDAATRFYQAINAYLGAGDSSSLVAVLHPGFIDHTESKRTNGTTDDFLSYLRSLRATFPGLRFDPSIISAQGNTAGIDLALTGNLTGSFAGLPVEAGRNARGYELLRVEDARIAERWASRHLPPKYESALDWTEETSFDWATEGTITRYSFPPQFTATFSSQQGLFLIMEEGQLALSPAGATDSTYRLARLRSGTTNEIAAIAGRSENMETGDVIHASGAGLLRLSNELSREARALVLSLRSMHPQDYFGFVSLFSNLDGPSELFQLIGSGQIEPSGRPLSISIGRATLPPGAGIPRHFIAGVEMLVVSEGLIEASVSDASATTSRSDSSISSTGKDQELIGPGDGLVTEAGGEMEYRVVGATPATAWFITITNG